MSRRQQLLKLAKRGLGVLIQLVLDLEAQLRALRRQVQQLKDQLAQTSRNSGKPPSSDGLAKPPRPAPSSLRKKTGRKPGGQKGHPGRTLQPVPKADQTLVHALKDCPCGHCRGVSLQNQPVIGYVHRQVFEVPRQPLVVTEHQAQIKRCPVSGLEVTAAFPEGVTAPAQYGPRFRGQMIYLNTQHFIPFTRLTLLCEDLYGQPLSEGTVVNAEARVFVHLEPFEKRVKFLLPLAPLNHADESGLRVAGRLHWLHVVSNAHLTFYGVHRRRGVEAMNAFGILPLCKNWIMHDHWAPYFTYLDCLHALCNQHHLRELKFLFEQHQEAWADELSQFLLHAKQRVKKNGVLGKKAFKKLQRQYRAILVKGRGRHPHRQSPGAQSKAANLLDRLEEFDLNLLAFCLDPDVPFTNNQAERDIRMEKVRQKVSGCFRTLHGAEVFLRIRSYISTCRKLGRNILDELENAVRGKPFIPSMRHVPKRC